MSTLQIKQIEHQLKNGQKTFGDKTIRSLLAEIERLEALLKEAAKQAALFAQLDQAAE